MSEIGDDDSENELSDYADEEESESEDEQQDQYIPILIEKYRLVVSFINGTARADTFEVNVAVLNKKMSETMYNESVVNEETLSVINDLNEQLGFFEATIKNFLESNSKMFRFRLDVLRDLFTPQQISQLESTRQKLEELTEINSQQPDENISLADLETYWNTLSPREKNELEVLTALQFPDQRDFGSVQDYVSIKKGLQRLTGLSYPDKSNFLSVYQFESARREYLEALNYTEDFYDDPQAKVLLQTLTGVKYPDQDKFPDFEHFKYALVGYYKRIYNVLYHYWDKYELAKYAFFTDISIFLDEYWQPFADKERQELIKIAKSMNLTVPKAGTPEYVPFLKSLTKYLEEGYVYKTGIRKTGGVYEKIENPSVKKILSELFATHGYVYKKGSSRLRAGKQMVYNPSMRRRFQELKKEQKNLNVQLDDEQKAYLQKLEVYMSMLVKLDKQHLINCIFTTSRFKSRSIVVTPSQGVSPLDYVIKERTPLKASPDEGTTKSITQLQAFLQSENDALKKLQQGVLPEFLKSYNNFTKPRRLSQQDAQQWHKLFKQIKSQRQQILNAGYLTKLQQAMKTKNDELLVLQQEQRTAESRLKQNFENLKLTRPEGLSQADSKQWDKLTEQITQQSETPKMLKDLIEQIESRQDISPQEQDLVSRKKRQLAAIKSGALKQNAVIRQGYVRKLSEIYKSYNSKQIENTQRQITRVLEEISKLKKNYDLAADSVKPGESVGTMVSQNPNARYIGTDYKSLDKETLTQFVNSVKRKLNLNLVYYLELYDMNELMNNTRMIYNGRQQRVISTEVYTRLKQFLTTRLTTIEPEFEKVNRQSFKQAILEISSITGKELQGDDLSTIIDTKWNGETLRDVYGNNVFETLLFATNTLQFYPEQANRTYNKFIKDFTPPQQQEYTRAQAMHDGKLYTVQYLHKNPSTGQPTLMYKSELEMNPRSKRYEVVNKETVRNGSTPYIKIELRTAQEGNVREVWKEVNTGEIKKIKVVK